MTTRKVDVMDKAGKVLHTYPITVGAPNSAPKDSDYASAALTAARAAKLVPETDFSSLKTRVHATAA